MNEIRSVSLWNNPQRVVQARGAYFKPERALSQTTAPAPQTSAAPQPDRGVPTGLYVAGGVLVAAIIGIVAL
jgi:hypothetical protein